MRNMMEVWNSRLKYIDWKNSFVEIRKDKESLG